MHQMKRHLLGEDFDTFRSSVQEGLYDRAASTPTFRKAERFNQYGSIEAEFLLQPESRSIVQCLIYNYSAINQDSHTSHSTIPDIRGKVCLTELDLDLALSSLPKGKEFPNKDKFWFCIRPQAKASAVATTSASRPSGKRLTLESCLCKLKNRFNLPPLAVLDALQSSHRPRLDRSNNNLYLSLISFAFSPSEEDGQDDNRQRSFQCAPTLRSSSFEWMGYASSRNLASGMRMANHGECSLGTLADLVHRGIPTSSTQNVSKVHNIARGSVSWQRVCFFLNEEAVITVFRDDSEFVIEEVSNWFSEPELHLLELSKGVDFLCYYMIKSVVASMDDVMTSYRVNLLELEEAAFLQDAPKRHTDLAHTRLLHLQQQELAILRQQLFPACRVLASLQTEKMIAEIVNSASDPGNGGEHRRFMCDETLDYIEEVEDQLKNQVVEIEGLVMRCRDLSDLRFSLQNYRSSVAQQMLAGVSVIFMPLTFIAGIYGTNFLILPELTWGIVDGDDPQPAGFPLGYCWMLSVMLISGLAATILLHRLKVF